MIYGNITMSKNMLVTTDNSAALPTTVIEMTNGSCMADDEGITVLDLSNPRDVALVTEAGYSVVDLSASMHSTMSDSSGSSDTVSIATDDFSDLDPEIARAAAQAAESGSLIPLIKEELKHNIQKRRLEQGKQCLQVDLTKRRRQEKLTSEEAERRDRRRERNKVAAQKCRMKRRERADILEDESSELEDMNETLRDQIQKLEAEKETLRNMLRTHDICPRTCNVRLSTCSDDEEDDHRVVVPDANELDVQLELEIGSSPVASPFNVDLVCEDHAHFDEDGLVFTK